tara:strand:+ start:703 stop:1041 length:339 start_codon:yes stop_codon:yes gene_type:complete
MKKKETFVPIEEIADHFAVSVSTIRAWVRRKNITPDSYIKVGSTYRFRISDVTDSLLANGSKADPTEDGLKTSKTSHLGVQKQAEEMVASHMERKESLVTAKEMEALFDEDI